MTRLSLILILAISGLLFHSTTAMAEFVTAPPLPPGCGGMFYTTANPVINKIPFGNSGTITSPTLGTCDEKCANLKLAYGTSSNSISVEAKPAASHSFKNWVGGTCHGSTNPKCVFVPATGSMSPYATAPTFAVFEPTNSYTLNVTSVLPSSSCQRTVIGLKNSAWTCAGGGNCSIKLKKGDAITLEAKDGDDFVRFSSLSGVAATTTRYGDAQLFGFAMNNNYNIVISFASAYTVRLFNGGPGLGSITAANPLLPSYFSQPAGFVGMFKVAPGTTVSYQATAASGRKLQASWEEEICSSGQCSSGVYPGKRSVTLGGAYGKVTATAKFK